MNLTQRWQPVLLCRLGAALLFGWLAFVSVAIAGGNDPTPGPIVALAADGATGSLFKTDANTLYRSDDEGRHWRRLATPATSNGGRIAAVAGRKDVLYIAGPGLGVVRSEDGGRRWTARTSGLPDLQVTALTIHADQPDTLYAYVAGHGIFRSDNGGGSWRLMDNGPQERIVQFVHSNMPGSMQTGWLFAATTTGVNRSMDCFCGWRDAGALARAVRAVAYDPHEPQRVYAVAKDGLLVSTDGGEQWKPVKAPTADVVSLTVIPSGELYAITSKGELFRSADHAATWERVHA